MPVLDVSSASETFAFLMFAAGHKTSGRRGSTNLLQLSARDRLRAHSPRTVSFEADVNSVEQDMLIDLG